MQIAGNSKLATTVAYIHQVGLIFDFMLQICYNRTAILFTQMNEEGREKALIVAYSKPLFEPRQRQLHRWTIKEREERTKNM